LTRRFAEAWVFDVFGDTLQCSAKWKQLLPKQQQNLQASLQNWPLKPNGTQGYKKAEVTRGGVDTAELSSKTMMSKSVAGLFFIGEVVDVTGWLGGYNFQWAWSSAYAAGQYA
jgi:predicted flavoprotein YhiN